MAWRWSIGSSGAGETPARPCVVASHQAERVMRLADGWARLDGGLLVEAGGSGVSARRTMAGWRAGRGGTGMNALRADAAVAWQIAPQGRAGGAAGPPGGGLDDLLRGAGAAAVRLRPRPRLAEADRCRTGPAVAGDRVRLAADRCPPSPAGGRRRGAGGAGPLPGRAPCHLPRQGAGRRWAPCWCLAACCFRWCAILYGIDLATAWPALLATLVLGAIGLAAVGTFYAGVTVRMRPAR